MKRFRRKPVIVEALQLRRDTWDEMCDFIGIGGSANGIPQGYLTGNKVTLCIPTLGGALNAVEGDWIIRGIKGEFYPCKPDIFKQTYELVKDDEGAT